MRFNTPGRPVLAIFTALMGAALVLFSNGSCNAQPGGKKNHPFDKRTPAPSLEGGSGWLNSAGPVDLKDLRGKFVILDFWTYCCINCMHVLPELKKLEKAYPNNLVVIGVHSAKFDEEKDLENIRGAILRYEIEHPVINDPDHKLWSKFNVNSWPSLRIIDPEGNLVAVHSGETDFATLDGFMKSVLPYYAENKLLDEKPIKFDLEAAKAARTPLRFPGKILADEPGKRLFIADSNHNRIVVTDLAGNLLETIGAGTIGRGDGAFSVAQFDHPQGMALKGDTLYVADTENHLLRKVDLKNKTVTTIAGIGSQARSAFPGVPEGGPFPGMDLPKRFVGPPATTGLNSPWDLWIHGDALFIAMAGPHQIWKMPLDESEIGPYAGNAREHITDGPLLPARPYQAGFSSFAQPSGLTSDGKLLYVADSEGSAVRSLGFEGKGPVKTLVGTPNVGSALFNFGDIDGPLVKARFQHCIAVAYHDGKIYVADTYNNKIKAIDLESKTASTLAGNGKEGKEDGAATAASFDEPAGLAIAAGKLYVADTNNHLIRTVDLKTGDVKTLPIAGLSAPGEAAPVAVVAADPGKKPSFRNPTAVKLGEVAVKPTAGQIELNVQLTLPAGWKMNTLAPTIYYIEAADSAGAIDRTAINLKQSNTEGKETFTIPLKLSPQNTGAGGKDTLTVSLNYNYCQGGPEGVCKFGAVVWTVPVTIDATAKETKVALPFTVPE